MVHRYLPVLAAALVAAAPAHAQRFQQDARAAIPLPGVLGAGNTGAAMPSAPGAFFVNPAHIAVVDLSRTRITFLGVRSQVSSDVFDKINFVLDDFDNAVETGLDELAEMDSDGDGDSDLRELYDEALVVGRKQGVVRASVELPTVQFSTSGVGVGVGVFGNTVSRVRFEPGAIGIPRVDGYVQADAMAMANVGTVIPGTALMPGMGSLAVGGTLKYVRRYVTYKNKSIDAFAEKEPVGVFAGSTMALDLGLHYANVVPMIPGAVDFGIAFYDVIGGGFDYELNSTFGGDLGDNEVEQVLRSFEERDGDMTYRAGLTYTFPAIPGAGALSKLAVSADYVSANTSEFDQPALGKFSIGTTAELASLVALRAGMSQGYASFGVGLHTRFAEIDYAFFGVENGRLPGQSSRYNHLVQLRFGLL